MRISFTHIKILIFTLILVVIKLDFTFSQWVNDPTSNTKLVIDPVDPVNITAFSDLSGGAYVFWEDKKGSQNKDVYFIRFNKDGEVSFRGDGKAISTRSGLKENPIAVVGPYGNAYVLWRGKEKNVQELYIQKLSKAGLRLWRNEGIQLTDTRLEKTDYSLSIDNRGIIHISYILKSNTSPAKYYLKYQSLDANGKFLTDSLKGNLYSSGSTITETQIVPDNSGGKFIFWLESIKNKTMLRSQYIDAAGSKKWGSKPLTISKENKNVIDYTVGRIEKNTYTAYTYQGANKIIYQNLISSNGKLLWSNDGLLLTYQNGSQSNPQFAFMDSSIVVSWTNEIDNVKDVFIQRFNLEGKRLWGNNGKRIINIKGNQFGQRIVQNEKGTIILAWIDKKNNSSASNLYIQKIDPNGNLLWDSSGVIISSSKQTEKSYLNLISDGEGGAIAVFKGTANKKNEIFGQKIFSSGTYASHMLGFEAEVISDSVKIYWYAANESNGTLYEIYRSASKEDSEGNWKLIASLKKKNNSADNYYEYHDQPDISGTLYYRVAQKISNNHIQYSDIKKVDYFIGSETIILGQNSPNPFSENTTISFYLPKSEKVTFEFFNSNIEIIKKIEDTLYPSGKNEIVFNADNLPAGIYFYRIKVGKFVDVKKMIITD